MAAEIQTSKQWLKTGFALGIGSVVAWPLGIVIAGAVTAGATGVGAIAVSSAASGVIGATVTKIAGNVMDAEPTRTVRYYPYRAQQRFRAAVTRFLDIRLEPVLLWIRTNSHGTIHDILQPELSGSLAILKCEATTGTRLTIELLFEVQPKPGTGVRPVEEGKPPLQLPEYVHQATETYDLPRETHDIFDGVGRSAINGLLVGGLGAGLVPFTPFLQHFHWLPNFPGTPASAIVGLPTLLGIGGAATESPVPPQELETFTSHIDFAAEIATHINRVVKCASHNAVGLSYKVVVGLSDKVTVAIPPDKKIVNAATFNTIWYTSQAQAPVC